MQLILKDVEQLLQYLATRHKVTVHTHAFDCDQGGTARGRNKMTS